MVRDTCGPTLQDGIMRDDRRPAQGRTAQRRRAPPRSCVNILP